MASRRQTVTAFPSATTGAPSGPVNDTRFAPIPYASSPLSDTTTSVVLHEMANPGTSKLCVTNSRMAAFPTRAGVPGGKTVASSAQYDRMRSTSLVAAVRDHSASSLKISADGSLLIIGLRAYACAPRQRPLRAFLSDSSWFLRILYVIRATGTPARIVFWTSATASVWRRRSAIAEGAAGEAMRAR